MCLFVIVFFWRPFEYWRNNYKELFDTLEILEYYGTSKSFWNHYIILLKLNFFDESYIERKVFIYDFVRSCRKHHLLPVEDLNRILSRDIDWICPRKDLFPMIHPFQVRVISNCILDVNIFCSFDSWFWSDWATGMAWSYAFEWLPFKKHWFAQGMLCSWIRLWCW